MIAEKKDPITSATAGYTNENAVFLIEPFIWRALARCRIATPSGIFFFLLLEDRLKNENKRCAHGIMVSGSMTTVSFSQAFSSVVIQK